MNDTLVLSQRPRIDRTDRALAVVAVAVFALAALIFAPFLSTPGTVDQVSVRNGSGYPVDVAVAGVDDGGWLQLGTADQGDQSFTDVIDPGSTWLVRFSSGEVVETVSLTAASIRANHWTIVVPTKVTDEIRLSGADAPPDANS